LEEGRVQREFHKSAREIETIENSGGESVYAEERIEREMETHRKACAVENGTGELCAVVYALPLLCQR